MNATNKRLVSILLALAMVLALLPMAVFAAGTTRLYCAAPSSWTNCNVYWWNSADTNPDWPGVAMTKGDDGIWYYDVPSDASNVIFNNGSAQTANLDMPTDDKVQFNYDAKEWVTYGSEVEVVETVYYLRGTMNNWGVSDPMTKVDDTTYTITMDLAAGTYEYKAAVEDWSWSCPGGGNLTLTLASDDTVTFTLDLAANSLTYTLGSGTVVEVEYFLRGTMNEWSTNDKMVKQADGTYAITLTLSAGTYEYKAATADWSFSVPGGDNAVLTLTDAVTNVTFVLDVAAGTLTNDAPTGEEPEEPPVVETVYYLRGTMNNWGLDNPFTNNGDGIYTVTVSLTAGTYEYKAAIEDWTWAVPEGGNLVLELAEDADVTFTLNTNDYTLTNDAPVVEEPVEYTYYVAGSEGLCGAEWDPAYWASEMAYNEETGLYEILLEVWSAGTYEYKITTGSWETPSYGPAEGGNYTVVMKNPGEVTITFNEETKEVTCSVREFGEYYLKFQLNADASADDATVDLRMITFVESLDYKNVEFQITINGETAFANCEVVYEAINANGQSLTCQDIFGKEGYLVTYTLAGIPAEYYGADIQVCAVRVELDGFELGTNYRTIVLSDVLA